MRSYPLQVDFFFFSLKAFNMFSYSQKHFMVMCSDIFAVVVVVLIHHAGHFISSFKLKTNVIL